MRSYEDHLAFKSLLEYMLEVDPKKRPSAQQSLNHEFFKISVAEESEERDSRIEKEYIDNRYESKSTEKTYVSNRSTLSSNGR